jgi:hypothetical protein
MTEIVSLTLKTQFGVDVYSCAKIQNFSLYRKVLEESKFNVKLEYKGSDRFEYDDIEEFEISDVVLQMKTVTKSQQSVNDIHETVNSSSSHPLFDIIEKAYEDTYKEKISDNLIFKKYATMKNTIKTAENHINSIGRQFDKISLNKLSQFTPATIWENVYYKLNNEDPRIIDVAVNKKLEEIIAVYNNISHEQKERIRYSKKEAEEARIKEDRLREELERKKEAERIRIEKEIIERKMLARMREKEKLEAEERQKRQLEEKRLLEESEKELKLRLRKEEAVRLSQLKKQEILERQRVEEEKKRAEEEVERQRVLNEPEEKKQKRLEAFKKAQERQAEILKEKELARKMAERAQLREKKLAEHTKRLAEERKAAEIAALTGGLSNGENVDLPIQPQTPLVRKVEEKTELAPVREETPEELTMKLMAEQRAKRASKGKRSKK